MHYEDSGEEAFHVGDHVRIIGQQWKCRIEKISVSNGANGAVELKCLESVKRCKNEIVKCSKIVKICLTGKRKRNQTSSHAAASSHQVKGTKRAKKVTFDVQDKNTLKKEAYYNKTNKSPRVHP